MEGHLGRCIDIDEDYNALLLMMKATMVYEDCERW